MKKKFKVNVEDVPEELMANSLEEAESIVNSQISIIPATEEKELTEEEINREFSDLIRDKLTDEEFWKWVPMWQHADNICEIAENWPTDSKIETLKNFGHNIVLKDDK